MSPKTPVSLTENSFAGGTHGDDHPVIWSRDQEKGRFYFNGLMHKTKTFNEDWMKKHTVGSLRYLAGYSGCMDSTYAEYSPKATNQPANACVNKIIRGCTDSTYEEYDSAANTNVPNMCKNKILGIWDRNAASGIILNGLSLYIGEAGTHSFVIRDIRGNVVRQQHENGMRIYNFNGSLQAGIYYITVKSVSRTLKERLIVF